MYNGEALKEIFEEALMGFSFSLSTPSLSEPIEYILKQSGKRLRPILLLMGCNLYSENIENAILPAIGIELFHNSTLVHDDIMDKATLRRNAPTVQAKYGINQAILSGDLMMLLSSKCFQQLSPDISQQALSTFYKIVVKVFEGQQFDMDYELIDEISETEYLRMIELKTAELIAGSILLGAIIGGADKKECEKLYNFGIKIGLAFQIQDDMLDIWNNSVTFGKITGGDIIERKKTLPYILALQQSTPNLKKRLKELYSLECKMGHEERVEDVTAIYNSLCIKKQLTDIANKYIEEGFKNIDDIDLPTDRKEMIINYTQLLINRNR